MSIWRRFKRGLRALANRKRSDEDIADEVRHYLEEATAAHVAAGRSPADARRAAQLELGNATVVREQVRSYGWENAIETLVADLRHAARRLRGSPGFTAVSVLTLALGIGVSTAIFSALSPILFEPLPYPDPDRIVMVWDRRADDSRLDATFGTYRELVERSRSFAALAVMRPWQPVLTGAAEPERLDGQRVSADYFRALGVAPALGRDFRESDDFAGGPAVAILSHGLWQRRFGGDPAIVGSRVTLDGGPYTVVGVMPRTFENVLAPLAEVWRPLQYDASLPSFQGREWGHHLRMVGRLRPGVGAARAVRELDGIARAAVPEFPRPIWASLERGFSVDPLQADVTRSVRPTLLAIAAAVVLVLLVACVNVTNLLLTRGARRRGEFALRAALGAGRTRLIRQLLTESLLLALIGGALGMVVAELGVSALVAFAPPELPRVGAIGLDAAVFAYALGVTTLVGLGVGLVPALHGSRDGLHVDLLRSSRRMAGGHSWTRSALVVSEVALALMLLVGAGLLLRSLERLFAVDPGFEASHVLTMQVHASGPRFEDDSVTHRFFGHALDAVRRVPGVASAAWTSQLPLSGELDGYGVHFESTPIEGFGEDGSALRYVVTPGYIELMGVPLRRGRSLAAYDAAGAPRVALINESFAERRFPGRDPIGERLHLGTTDSPWYTIVGVVGDVKQVSLAAGASNAVYIPASQWYFTDRALWLVVRAHGDAAALTPAIRRAVWSVDDDQPIVRVATMEDRIARSEAGRRFALIIFEAFALAALALAAIGIYGVLAGSVAERTREIGVRSALGATRAGILALVIRQGMRVTGLGIVIGLSGAIAASHAIATLLFDISRLDPVTYLGVVSLLLGVSGIACAVPAWRAARVDPSITLRAE